MADSRGMNILMIVSDQQRRDLVGCYGCTDVRTPVVDRLAREGVLFDNAWTVIPICAPARASMLTGLRPVHHGITRNPESGEVAGRDFPSEPVCYHNLLSARGYRSFHVGKWHVGTVLEPADCGAWGVYHPGYGYPAEHPHYREYLERRGLPPFRLTDAFHGRFHDGSRACVLSARQDQPVEAAIPYYLAEQAIENIRQVAADGQPFNLRLDFWGPHVPYLIPEPYYSMYDDVSVPEWPSFRETFEGKPRVQSDYLDYWGIQDLTWDEWERLVRGCFGYTTLIDDQVGRVLDVLRELGIEEQTAVFYTADHGGMVGAHRLCDKGPFMYDEILRVPLIAKIPGVTSAGTREATWVYNYDLMPTVLELAGAPAPEGLDAQSLLPVLRGDVSRENVAFMEFHGHQLPYTQRVVRTETHKYVFNGPDVDELYDLAADPHEMTNRVDDTSCRSVLRDLRERMDAFLRETDDPILRYFADSRLRS